MKYKRITYPTMAVATIDGKPVVGKDLDRIRRQYERAITYSMKLVGYAQTT